MAKKMFQVGQDKRQRPLFAAQVRFGCQGNALLFAISASPSLLNFCGISEVPGITKRTF